MNSISIKGDNGNFVTISVKNYERGDPSNTSDANWLSGSVNLVVGSFSGHFDLSLETHDFVRFQNSLSEALKFSQGKAVFQTCEEQIYIELKMTNRGTANITGVAVDHISGSRLSYSFETDQTYLSESLKEVANIVTIFPVRK